MKTPNVNFYFIVYCLGVAGIVVGMLVGSIDLALFGGWAVLTATDIPTMRPPRYP